MTFDLSAYHIINLELRSFDNGMKYNLVYLPLLESKARKRPVYIQLKRLSFSVCFNVKKFVSIIDVNG